MADHTAPDYYEQVAKESKEKIARDDAKIDERIDKLVIKHMGSLEIALEREFGRSAMRSAKLGYIEDILYNLAHVAAYEAKGVMIDSHYRETRTSLDATLNAVLTGIKIGEGAT